MSIASTFNNWNGISKTKMLESLSKERFNGNCRNFNDIYMISWKLNHGMSFALDNNINQQHSQGRELK